MTEKKKQEKSSKMKKTQNVSIGCTPQNSTEPTEQSEHTRAITAFALIVLSNAANQCLLPAQNKLHEEVQVTALSNENDTV